MSNCKPGQDQYTDQTSPLRLQMTKQVLLSSSPILQQSGMLRKLLVGSRAAGVGGAAGPSSQEHTPAEQQAPSVAVASDAVLQSLLLYSMSDSLKAAHATWTDLLSTSTTQQVRHVMMQHVGMITQCVCILLMLLPVKHR